MAAQQEKGNQKGLIQKLCKQMLDDTYPLMRTERPVQTGRLLYLENHWLGQWFKRAKGDEEERKTPFAIIKMRSANCTTNSKGRTSR